MAIQNILFFVASAAAHFGLTYPEWRADTLTADEDSGYDQRIYPCANVRADQGPTTDWPLTGGSVTLDLHHDWTYLFLNLGLGPNATNFNITLSPPLWNATGSGTLCIPHVPLVLPDGVEDGAEASLQVVTVGGDGAALYNCANLRLVREADEFGGKECKTEGVEYYVVGEVEDPVTSEGEVPDASAHGGGGDEEEEDTDSRAVGRLPAVSILGFAVAFAVGLTL